MRERESVCARRESVRVCECGCVCMSVYEQERESERECVKESERVRVRVFQRVSVCLVCLSACEGIIS